MFTERGASNAWISTKESLFIFQRLFLPQYTIKAHFWNTRAFENPAPPSPSTQSNLSGDVFNRRAEREGNC
jgi:hypothetical protein